MSAIELLKACGGCYESPRDEAGNILGPLVAYAGKYKTDNGEGKQWVGPDYFNFAMAEQWSRTLDYFARRIVEKTPWVTGVRKQYVVIGMPMGGIKLATSIGDICDWRSIFAEKKVTALADPGKGLKEQSDLMVDRHEILPGDIVFVVEDVCNNFSTTQKIVDLIAARGARCGGICCAINRSPEESWNGLFIASAIFKPSEQYHQEDPKVAGLIAKGMIAWKPKHEWARLKAAMESKE